jgi:hypothetical protein
MPEFVIASRHPAVLEWLKRFPDIPKGTPIIMENACADGVAGKIVIGNIPLFLASRAKMVLAVEFEGAPPRGQEYTLEDMLKSGAKLSGYIVTPVNPLLG